MAAYLILELVFKSLLKKWMLIGDECYLEIIGLIEHCSVYNFPF